MNMLMHLINLRHIFVCFLSPPPAHSDAIGKLLQLWGNYECISIGHCRGHNITAT